LKWDFPGNLSELLHTLERAVALSGGDTIRSSHLPPDVASAPDRPERSPLPAAGGAIQPLGDAVARFERDYIQRALEQVGGHKTRAAALLGISRKTLWERLRDDGDLDD
jgi:DNA-binding NtrC family response regulator